MLPSGFDGIYRCKNHPERDAVAPIASRLCSECNEEALRAYVDALIMSDMEIRWEGQPEHDKDTRSEPLYAAEKRHYADQARKRARAK